MRHSKFLFLSMAAALFFSCDMLNNSSEEGDDDSTISDVQLSVSVNEITYKTGNTDNNSFIVTSNSDWTSSATTNGVVYEPKSGSAGETTVVITNMTVESADITISTRKRFSTDVQKKETIHVTLSTEVDPEEERDDVDWQELPKILKENADYKYITHRTTTHKTGVAVRNYSACYDIVAHNPVWVAYPCHSIYREGGWSRTDPDPWRPDPDMTLSEQSIIFGTDWEAWPWSSSEGKSTDLYQYWSTNSDGSAFTRGHLLRSADRSGAGSEINIQTFYPTNIAPEIMLYPDIHGQLEDKLTSDWTCRDTIYVVSGCYYGDRTRITYDACNWGKQSSLSKPCLVPTHQFKIYLRTKTGNTGKPISECASSELMAIGFWLPQRAIGEAAIEGGNLADFAKSVDEIENLMGNEFEFFPGAPDSVTAAYNISDWGIN